MTRKNPGLDLGLGPVGATLDVRDDRGHLDDAVLLEKLGYSALWIAGGRLPTLDPLRDVVRATETVRVGSAIIPARVHTAEDVAAFRRGIEATDPGRLVTGLGGVQGGSPLRTMNDYLDRLDAADPPVPADARVLAALGPRMLELSRERAAGALTLLVNPEYTARARQSLGDETALIVMEYVVVETDPRVARDAVRDTVGFLTRVGGYPQNLRRMGFTDEDIAGPSDRLIDDVVAWGDVDAVAARLRRHLDAGADHVVLSVQPTSAHRSPRGVARPRRRPHRLTPTGTGRPPPAAAARQGRASSGSRPTACRPPSTGRTTPLTKLASSDSR